LAKEWQEAAGGVAGEGTGFDDGLAVERAVNVGIGEPVRLGFPAQLRTHAGGVDDEHGPGRRWLRSVVARGHTDQVAFAYGAVHEAFAGQRGRAVFRPSGLEE